MKHLIPRTRVAVVGAGYVSGYHVRALQELGWVDVVAVADLDEHRARQIAARFGIGRVCRALGDLSQEGLDVVHILTPPSSHCALTLEALEMGCDVFVEKPMAPTTQECDLMIATARRLGKVLSVNHSARLDPVVRLALDRVHAGVIGEVLGVDFFRSSDYPAYGGGAFPPQYRTGSFPFQDLGVHALYLMEAFLGDLARVEVRYWSTGRDPHLLFDEWRIQVEGVRGSGQAYLSWNVRPMQNELVVHGTRGVLHVDCYLQTLTVRHALLGPKPVQRIVGALSESARAIVQVTVNALLFATGRLHTSPGIYVSVHKFHQARRSGQPPPVPAEEGRRITAWMEEASRRADAEHERLTRLPKNMPPARVLVTGASGFLGRAVVRRLLETEPCVRVLVRRRGANVCSGDRRLLPVYGDLGHPETVDLAVRGVEVVYHVGATMRGGRLEFEAGTIWGTRNVIEACLRHGVRRLVHVSSLTVLDHAGHRPTPITEQNASLEPNAERRGLYTQTKLAAERMVLEAIRTRGLPAVILRPGQIFGPGAEHVTPSGVIGLAGVWIVVGSGRSLLPLVYVEDIADAILAASSREDVVGDIFHIVDPTPITQKEYAAAVRRGSGPKPLVIRLPGWSLILMASGVEILSKLLKRELPLSRYRVHSIYPLSGFDGTATSRKLGWAPRIGAAEGMRRTFGDAALRP